MKAISVINLGSLEGIFAEKDKRVQDGGSKKWDAEDITLDKGIKK